MTKHPLQDPVDRLVDYLKDARSLYTIIEEQLARTRADRLAGGAATGRGRPRSEWKSLNRAVLVASVGAVEAFYEDLALTAIASNPARYTPPENGWYPIAGSRGIIQTPNPFNLAKLFWTFFRYDPRTDWDIKVPASSVDLGVGSSSWRSKTAAHTGPQAVAFMDAMVQVRHGFAHQEAKHLATHAGIVQRTPTGGLSIQSHHALNSISAVVQVAIQSAEGLGRELQLAGEFRWIKSFSDASWEPLLADTPVAASIRADWGRVPAGF